MSDILDSFFDKNGTIKQLVEFDGARRQMQSTSSMDRIDGLGKMVKFIMSLFA